MNLCDRCIATQKTCCQRDPRILLTQGDVRRIALSSGSRDFYELKPCPDQVMKDADDVAYDPNWLRYTVLPGNFRRLLKTDNEGVCVFLAESGCRLPEDARPLVCRIFPYNYNEFGLIGFVYYPDIWCPIHLLEEGEILSQTMGASWEQADRWRAMYYEELRADYRERENPSSSL